MGDFSKFRKSFIGMFVIVLILALFVGSCSTLCISKCSMRYELKIVDKDATKD